MFCFVFKTGLVQGDSLSAPLCNIYFGHLAKQHLAEFMNSNPEKTGTGNKSGTVNRFLARGMDDFIFASTDEEEANRFRYKICSSLDRT
jgi:hypothetical protein